MPIPSPGTYDQASQATLLAVKAKTDLIPAAPAAQAKIDASLYTSRLAPATTNTAGAATITIQPPAGETWVIYLSAFAQTGATGDTCTAEIQLFDGATTYPVAHRGSKVIANSARIGIQACLRITNALYAQIVTTGNGVVTTTHTYHGWKE